MAFGYSLTARVAVHHQVLVVQLLVHLCSPELLILLQELGGLQVVLLLQRLVLPLRLAALLLLVAQRFLHPQLLHLQLVERFLLPCQLGAHLGLLSLQEVQALLVLDV